MRLTTLIALIIAGALILHSNAFPYRNILKDVRINDGNTTPNTPFLALMKTILEVYGGPITEGFTDVDTTFHLNIIIKTAKLLRDRLNVFGCLLADFGEGTKVTGNDDDPASHAKLFQAIAEFGKQHGIQELAVLMERERAKSNVQLQASELLDIQAVIEEAFGVTPYREADEYTAMNAEYYNNYEGVSFTPVEGCTSTDPVCPANINRWVPLRRRISNIYETQEFLFSWWGFTPTHKEFVRQLAKAVPPPPRTDNPETASLAYAEIAQLLEAAIDMDERERTKTALLQVGFGFGKPQFYHAVGQWFYVAWRIANQRSLRFCDAVDLFHRLAIVLYDTLVAVYRTKKMYWHARPLSQIQCSCLQMTQNTMWEGYYSISKTYPIGRFIPYALYEVYQPASPSYVSEVAAISFAAAAFLEKYLQSFSDQSFQLTVTVPRGANFIEPDFREEYLSSQMCCENIYRPFVPPEDQTYTWNSLTRFAEDLSYAQIRSGYAYASAISEGRILGTKIGELFAAKIQDEQWWDNIDIMSVDKEVEST